MSVAKNPRVVIGAAAFAGLAALGGVGAVLGNDAHSGSFSANSSRLNITEVVTTTSAPPTGSSNLNKLMGILPKGFSSSNCQAVNPSAKDALATVDCSQNTVASGVSAARFNLYPDQATLDSHFNSGSAEDVASPCPGGINSPGTWHYHNTPDQAAGQLVCGTYNDKPDLLWSQNSELLLGDIQGSDMDALYDWWAKNS
jgi:hypothetical protein